MKRGTQRGALWQPLKKTVAIQLKPAKEERAFSMARLGSPEDFAFALQPIAYV